MPQSHLAIFQGKNIRRIIYRNEWWFSVIDIVEVLTESSIPRRYWSDLKIKLKQEGYTQLYEKIVQLKLKSADGKKYETDCANAETLFRIIQSIPSPKAEPFKRWLARVGYERVQEIEDPELATKRTRALYKAKGYSDDWIEKRMRGIAIREELTDEWKKRNVGGDIEYAILTAEISKATFGMSPSEYKKLKHLKRENLRDHMDDLELIFTMLGEASTTRIARAKKTQGFRKNKKAAHEGGTIAGNARRQLERKSGQRISTSHNYLKSPQYLKLKPNMKIVVFLHGTLIMHQSAIGKTREEIIEQVKRQEESVRDFSSYVPIANAVVKLKRWVEQDAEIHYLSALTVDKKARGDEIIGKEGLKVDQEILDRYGFPKRRVYHRQNGESYAEIVERIVPDILIEDDCESIGGAKEMTITFVRPEIKKRIKSIVVKEFSGIDHLPNDVSELTSLP